MSVTTSDVTNDLVGLTINETTTGYESVILPKKNPDGSYTISRTTGQSAAGNTNFTFSAYTFPNGGGPGLTYTSLGTTFYVKVLAFSATQVYLQPYTADGTTPLSFHALLTDGGTIQQIGETLPITLFPTGSSYTPPCFARGTIIATLDGDVAVEDLREGDLVLTISGEAKPIVWVGSRNVSVSRHPRPETVRPVCIRRSAFAPNVPSQDLVLSPDHNVFTEGVLIPAKCLVNGRNVVTLDMASVEYFHVELAQHDVLYANGLEAETYLDAGNRTFFAGQGVTVAHPDFASIPDQNYFAWEAKGCARLVLDGPEVERTRARLAERATELANRPSLRRSA